MKKFLCLALTLAMLFSLCACDAGDAHQPANPSSPATESATPEPENTTELDHEENTPPRLSKTTSADMSLETVTNLYRHNNVYGYVYSTDLATAAFIMNDGRIGYVYKPHDSQTQPALPAWWETHELPEWVTYESAEIEIPEWWEYRAEELEGIKWIITNYYLDLPDGRLDAISPDEPIYTLRDKNGTHIVYADATYLYKNGIKQE